MARIVNNRICYNDHNVLMERSVWTMDHMLEIEAALTPEGDARLHRAQLNSFPNVGTYCEIEKPNLTITPMWATDALRLAGEPPTMMLATAELHNGNFLKTICVAQCLRSESFYALYGILSQHGIDVGPKARRDAETKYFQQYDEIVASLTKE